MSSGGVDAANVAASINAVNQVLAMTQQKTMEADAKLMETTVAQKVGAESGKGGNLDTVA